ncbi:uncharacterized protein LOC108949912 [Ciona intestinalis]
MKLLVLILSVLAAVLTSNGQKFVKVDTSSPVDLTLVPGSKGKVVVSAAMQKLDLVRGFGNDFSLMSRIALVESNLGERNNLSAGGIWQISPHIKSTLRGKLSSEVQQLITRANCVLGQPNTDFSNSDFSAPIRSAFAARIFIQQHLGSSGIPITIAQQARWWSNVYHPGGNASKFMEFASKTTNSTSCGHHKLDIWFVLDGSGSVGSSDFNKSLHFLVHLVKAFKIGPHDTRVGFSVYSTKSEIHSRLNQQMSFQALEKQILRAKYPRGSTNTGLALNDLLKNGFLAPNGARPASEGVPRFLVVLTDGKSMDNVTLPAAAVRSHGITVFGVGIGGGIDMAEIRNIASDPSSRYAFGLSGFDVLNVLRERLLAEGCFATAIVPNNGGVSVPVQSGQRHYSKFSFPSKGSIKLIFRTPPGAQGMVYVCGKVPTPNAALHDVAFPITEGTVTVYLNAELLRGSGSPGIGCGKQKDRMDVFITVKNTGKKDFDLNVTSVTTDESVLPTPGPKCLYGLASSKDSNGLQPFQCGPKQICGIYYGTVSRDSGPAVPRALCGCMEADQCGSGHCLAVDSVFNGYKVESCEKSTCCNGSLCNRPSFTPENVTTQTINCPAVTKTECRSVLESDNTCQFIKWILEVHHVWYPVFEEWRQNVAGVGPPQPNAPCMQLTVTCKNAGQLKRFNLLDGCSLPYCVDGHYTSGPGLHEWKAAQLIWQHQYTIWKRSKIVDSTNTDTDVCI